MSKLQPQFIVINASHTGLAAALMVCLQHQERTLRVAQSLSVMAQDPVTPAKTLCMVVVLMVCQLPRGRTMKAAQTLIKQQRKQMVGDCSCRKDRYSIYRMKIHDEDV